MGIINVSYKDDGTIDVYVDYNPILKNVYLGSSKSFTEVGVKVGENEYVRLNVYFTGLSIPYNSTGLGRDSGANIDRMDLALYFECLGDGYNYKFVVSYGINLDGDRVVLVEAFTGGRRKYRPILFFRAGSDYSSNKNIVARLPKFGEDSIYYTKSDAEARNVDRIYRKFVAWGREEKDFVEGGGDYLVYNTHISNIQDIIQLAVMVLSKILNKV